MAAVSNVNLVIHRGTAFTEQFNLSADDGSDLNLTGYSAVDKLRKHPTSTRSFDFSTAITILDSSIQISMTSTLTATIPSGRAYYDLIVISPDGSASKLVQGNVLVEDTSSTLA